MTLISDKDSETEVYDDEKEAYEHIDGVNNYGQKIKINGKILYVIIYR